VSAERREISDGTLVLRAERDGERHRISLSGELDLANSATVETELDAILADDECELVIDMRELEFIDSTGIALLVATLGRDDPERPRVRFVPSTSSAVARVLDLTGLGERLPLAESLPDLAQAHPQP
jgi:anti-sigma B factor antagonist